MASRWNLLWVLPWMIVSTLVVEICLFLPLYLLGLIVVPIASRHAARVWCPSLMDPSYQIQAYANPILNELWGNHEDGIEPKFDWWDGSAWQWYLRNPVCNMRFWPLISTRPSWRTRYIGSSRVEPGCRFIAWSGAYAGVRWEGKSWGFWFGWKINPRDAFFVPADDYRCWGLGIAMQVMRF